MFPVKQQRKFFDSTPKNSRHPLVNVPHLFITLNSVGIVEKINNFHSIIPRRGCILVLLFSRPWRRGFVAVKFKHLLHWNNPRVPVEMGTRTKHFTLTKFTKIYGENTLLAHDDGKSTKCKRLSASAEMHEVARGSTKLCGLPAR